MPVSAETCLFGPNEPANLTKTFLKNRPQIRISSFFHETKDLLGDSSALRPGLG